MKFSASMAAPVTAIVVSIIAVLVAATSGGNGTDPERVASLEQTIATLEQKASGQREELDRLMTIVGKLQQRLASYESKAAEPVPAAAGPVTIDEQQLRAAVDKVLAERGPDRRDDRRRPDRTELYKEMGLTEEQRTKLEELRDGMREKMRAAMTKIREDGGGFDQMRETGERIRQEMMESLKGVLSEEQLKKYQESTESRFGFGRRRGGGGGGR